MLLGKSVLKICSKFIGEHLCWSAILIKLQSNFIEITLQHGCPPVNLLHVFRTPFLKNTSVWLLLKLFLSCLNLILTTSTLTFTFTLFCQFIITFLELKNEKKTTVKSNYQKLENKKNGFKNLVLDLIYLMIKLKTKLNSALILSTDKPQI